jgi:RimJ/RimL family protein N-acetyltransferase
VTLRRFEPSGEDTARLAEFACSTGAPYEDEVEDWIRLSASGWLNDAPRAAFQRRKLALVESDDGSLVAVVAWQDIVRVDLEGIWLEVLAAATSHQHGGKGREAYDVTVTHLRTIDRNGDHLAGLVHSDNHRSKRLLASVGWSEIAPWDDHELWVGTL